LAVHAAASGWSSTQHAVSLDAGSGDSTSILVVMSLLTLPLLLLLAAAGADARYDGARVHYETYGTGREAVVFIHGWSCDLTFWRGQAPIYEKHRSLLIDLPGHGQSDKPDVSYTQERFARAIEAVMREERVDRIVLVGHSMGGAVGLTFLRLFPAKTKALVFVDAYLPAAPPDAASAAVQKTQMDALARRWREPNYRDSAAAMVEGMFSDKTTSSQRQEIRTKMLGTPQHVIASAFEGMMAMAPPKPGETYQVPVLAVMAGGPGRESAEAKLRAVFPNLRKYDEWTGSGHFLMMESADRFNRVLDEFLARLP
jgi:pimeloyl-ACP methyl ester carboxylesterase